jgi:hypothetical protein
LKGIFKKNVLLMDRILVLFESVNKLLVQGLERGRWGW